MVMVRPDLAHCGVVGLLGAGCCWDCGGLHGLGCALAWGYESVRSHGQDGLPGVSRTVVDCVGQAALLLLTKSCSASLGVRYPSAE